MRHISLILILLFILCVIPPVSSYDENAVTKAFEYTMLTGPVTQVAQDENGNIVCAGTRDGNVSCYDQTGVFLWRRQFDSTIKKVIINPGGARYLVQTWGNYVYYGESSSGTIYATYNGKGLEWFGIPGWNITDIDISKDGAYWGFTTNRQVIIKDSTNASVVVRDIDQNATGTFVSTYGGYSRFQIDPDKAYYVVSYDASGRLDHYSINGPSSPWYQGYLHRVSHTITGSPDGYLEHWNGTFIHVFNTTGTTTGNTVYVGANVTKPDLYDIRIVDANNNQLIQSYATDTGSNYVNLTVIFDNITASQYRPIYVYFGNSSAPKYSNHTAEVSDNLGSLATTPNSTFNTNFESGSPDDWVTGTPYPGYSTTTGVTEGLRSMYVYAWVYCQGSSVPDYDVAYITLVKYKGINGTTEGHGSDFLIDVYITSELQNIGHFNTNAEIYNMRTGAKICSLYNAASGSVTKTCTGVLSGSAGSTLSAGDIGVKVEASCDGSGVFPLSYGRTYAYIDNIRTFTNRSITSPPTHGTWGAVENFYLSTFKDTYSTTGITSFMDLPWNNPWLVLSTPTNIHQIQVDSTGFGTAYSVVASGTPYDIKTSDSGAYFIEGRGVVLDIYRLAAVKVATYSTGNNLQSVSISTSDGLWSVAGSLDGRWYVYSKAGQSTWYLYWASPSGSVPNSVSVDAHGGYICVGYQNANLSCYSTTPVPTTPAGAFYITVHVLKDDIPYITNCTLSAGEYAGDVYTFVRTAPTDTRGNFVFEAFATKYYRVRCGTENAESIIYATNTLTDYYISIKSQIISQTVGSSATYNSGTNTIDMVYNDGALGTTSVTFRIIDSGNYTEVYNNTFASNNVAQSWSVPSGYNARTYKVDCVAVRNTGSLHNMWIVRPSGSLATNLPMNTNMSNAICVIFLMVLSGLFGRVHSARGAIIVVGFFAFFIYMGWMTVPWWAATPIIVIAFVYGLIKAAPA